jgi:hypothetical protein
VPEIERPGAILSGWPNTILPRQPRHPDRPRPTVSIALDPGCQVDVLCQDCQNIAHLDAPAIVRNDRGDVSLIGLPFRFVCGCRRSRIIVSGAAYPDA